MRILAAFCLGTALLAPPLASHADPLDDLDRLLESTQRKLERRAAPAAQGAGEKRPGERVAEPAPSPGQPSPQDSAARKPDSLRGSDRREMEAEAAPSPDSPSSQVPGGKRPAPWLERGRAAGESPAAAPQAKALDAIVSEPPKPEAELPFFGDPPVFKDEQPEPDIPFFGAPLLVEKAQEERPQAEARPRRQSDRLEIPSEAKRRGDLSFLKGCWYFEPSILRSDAPGTPAIGRVQNRFCFNARGRGRFYQHSFSTGRDYSAPATARFSGGRLVLQHPRFANGPRITQCPETYTCEGQDAGTVCRVYNDGTRYLSRQGSLRISRRP